MADFSSVTLPDGRSYTVKDASARSDAAAKAPKINGVYFGVCSTAGDTAAKTVTLTNGTGFALSTGAMVCIKFTNANAVASPTLNVNGTGAKALKRYGTTAMSTGTGTNGWTAGAVLFLVYDGTNWVEHYWYNNSYSSMSASEATAGTATSARSITAANLKTAIKAHAKPAIYTGTLPTTGWTAAAAYGYYQDITFGGASFTADDIVTVDLNLTSDTNLQAINDAWACVLRATPTAGTARIRFKLSAVPTVAVPVRALVE